MNAPSAYVKAVYLKLLNETSDLLLVHAESDIPTSGLSVRQGSRNAVIDIVRHERYEVMPLPAKKPKGETNIGYYSRPLRNVRYGDRENIELRFGATDD